MENRVEFGRYIRFIRKTAGLTQAELSEAVGACPRTIGNIENGRTSCSLEMGVKLVDACGQIALYISHLYQRDESTEERIRMIWEKKGISRCSGNAGAFPGDGIHYAILDCLCESCHMYGIAVVERYDGVSVMLRSYLDLSRDRERVEALVERCNRGALDPRQLDEVVEDFLAEG